MGALRDLLVAICATVVAAEVLDCAPIISRRIIRYAASRLPEERRLRYEEEWLAHLDECRGRLFGLSHGVGCLASSYALKRPFGHHYAWAAAYGKVSFIVFRSSLSIASDRWKNWLCRMRFYLISREVNRAEIGLISTSMLDPDLRYRVAKLTSDLEEVSEYIVELDEFLSRRRSMFAKMKRLRGELFAMRPWRV